MQINIHINNEFINFTTHRCSKIFIKIQQKTAVFVKNFQNIPRLIPIFLFSMTQNSFRNAY